MSESPSPSHLTKLKPNTQASLSYSAQSSNLACQRIEQCHKFLTFARYIFDCGVHAEGSAGEHPSNDDREDFSALKQQWQALLDGSLLEGAGEVLIEALVDEAKVELGRLKEAEAMVQAREEWERVLELTRECNLVRQNADRLFSNAR